MTINANNILQTATSISTRLDEAFHFTTATHDHTNATLWRKLAHKLLKGPVPLKDFPKIEQDTIHSFPCTEYHNNHITGSLITQNSTDHSVSVQNIGTAWTWCFFDALLLAPIFKQTVTITSTCRHTSQHVTAVISPNSTATPKNLYVTLPVEFSGGTDLRDDFCCRSRAWLTPTPTPSDGVVVLPLNQALNVAQLVANQLGLTT